MIRRVCELGLQRARLSEMTQERWVLAKTLSGVAVSDEELMLFPAGEA
jgi:hypothetical protein